jgi:hypothetical protein
MNSGVETGIGALPEVFGNNALEVLRLYEVHNF